MEPTDDIVMTLGTNVAARIYFSDTRVPVESPGDTLVTLCNNVANMKYSNDARDLYRHQDILK